MRCVSLVECTCKGSSWKRYGGNSGGLCCLIIVWLVSPMPQLELYFHSIPHGFVTRFRRLTVLSLFVEIYFRSSSYGTSDEKSNKKYIQWLIQVFGNFETNLSSSNTIIRKTFSSIYSSSSITGTKYITFLSHNGSAICLHILHVRNQLICHSLVTLIHESAVIQINLSASISLPCNVFQFSPKINQLNRKAAKDCGVTYGPTCLLKTQEAIKDSFNVCIKERFLSFRAISDTSYRSKLANSAVSLGTTPPKQNGHSISVISSDMVIPNQETALISTGVPRNSH